MMSASLDVAMMHHVPLAFDSSERGRMVTNDCDADERARGVLLSGDYTEFLRIVRDCAARTRRADRRDRLQSSD